MQRGRTIAIPVSGLIGRERECADIRARLVERPLVTLAGIGGAGKTRLALAVAAEVTAAGVGKGQLYHYFARWRRPG